jgi:hypothetical protein
LILKVLICFIFQANFTDIGSVYQDERNRAALLLYKDGDRDQYLMVRGTYAHGYYDGTCVPGFYVPWDISSRINHPPLVRFLL